MDALDRVKYVLAQLPREDQRALARFLDDILVTDEDAERIRSGGGTVATVTRGRGARGSAKDDRAPTGRRTGPGAVTYRLERVKCGKPACTKCPHGPYTYKYWREDGRLRKRYVGKPRPRSPPDPSAAEKVQDP